MILRVVFILCAVIALICLAFGFAVKRRNYGFLITTALLIACDIACFFVTGDYGISRIKNYLSIYYACHALIYFSTLLTVIVMSGGKKVYTFLVPSGLISLYQIAIIISNYFRFLNNKPIVFSKRIMFGSTWWVAEKSEKSKAIFGFGAYRGLLYITALIIIVTLIMGLVHTAKVFRTRYYVLIGVQIAFSVLEFFSHKNRWPAWMLCIVMTPICVGTLYIIVFYPNRKLRDWSLMRFANEMSDGFILYNGFDDPLYMNDVLRDTLSEEMIDHFRDKKNLDEWISHTVDIDGIESIVYENENSIVYYKAQKIELKEKDHYIGTIYILHNTTDSVLRLTAMQEANEELEHAAKMKSDFLANMSHEIRTPMNAVIGMAEIAMREELPPNVMDYLIQIQVAGRNLLNIINDILDFSKIEAGKMEIVEEPYEPLSEINDISNMLVTRIGDKPIELFVASDTSVPHALLGDAMRIRQVIINIANNAIKFTREGYVYMSITCKKQDDENVVLTYHIVDTGQGIKTEDLGKLFTSFQQLDSKRNRNVEGTGLGLAISQRLIHAMGGEIGLTSEYGKGSDFWFTIPQKVVDPAIELVVREASEKFAYCVDEKSAMQDLFLREMDKLGIASRAIASLEEYKPSGKKDYVFFRKELYDESIEAFLDAHPGVMGMILVDFDSDFISRKSNLRVMRRPETTLNLVMLLNNEKIRERDDSTKAFVVDYTAPGAKILIVDDNEINIMIAEGLLAPIKAKCYGALSGKKAIEMLSKESFDVILMDHMMPEMDGMEATRIIREQIPSAKDTPIIALTANALEGVKEMFIKGGMNDFVAKPIDVRVLVSKLRDYIPSDKIKKGMSEEIVQESTETLRIADLDTEQAISMVGDESIYRMILKEYYRVIKTKADRIKECIDTQDWDDYTINVHALKSASRQIGATELADMAAALEKAGNDRNIGFITERTGPAIEKYLSYEPILAQLFSGEEDEDLSDKPAADKEFLTELLESIPEIADNLDIDGLEEVTGKIRSYSYPEDQKEFTTKLKEACEDMDFDLAVMVADEWKQLIG